MRILSSDARHWYWPPPAAKGLKTAAKIRCAPLSQDSRGERDVRQRRHVSGDANDSPRRPDGLPVRRAGGSHRSKCVLNAEANFSPLPPRARHKQLFRGCRARPGISHGHWQCH